MPGRDVNCGDWRGNLRNVKASPALEVAFEAKIQFYIMGCEAEEMMRRNGAKCRNQTRVRYGSEQQGLFSILRVISADAHM